MSLKDIIEGSGVYPPPRTRLGRTVPPPSTTSWRASMISYAPPPEWLDRSHCVVDPGTKSIYTDNGEVAGRLLGLLDETGDLTSGAESYDAVTGWVGHFLHQDRCVGTGRSMLVSHMTDATREKAVSEIEDTWLTSNEGEDDAKGMGETFRLILNENRGTDTQVGLRQQFGDHLGRFRARDDRHVLYSTRRYVMST